MTKVTMPPVSVIVESDYELRWVGAEPIAHLVERTGAKPGSVFITTDQAEAYAAAKFREALELAAATVVKGINERSSLIANVTRRNAASEILALTP